jgi:hypothetical protein
VLVCDFCSLLQHVVAGETTKERARAAQTENASRAVLTWIVCGAAAGNGKMVCGLVAKSSPPVENTADAHRPPQSILWSSCAMNIHDVQHNFQEIIIFSHYRILSPFLSSGTSYVKKKKKRENE